VPPFYIAYTAVACSCSLANILEVDWPHWRYPCSVRYVSVTHTEDNIIVSGALNSTYTLGGISHPMIQDMWVFAYSSETIAVYKNLAFCIMSASWLTAESRRVGDLYRGSLRSRSLQSRSTILQVGMLVSRPERPTLDNAIAVFTFWAYIILPHTRSD